MPTYILMSIFTSIVWKSGRSNIVSTVKIIVKLKSVNEVALSTSSKLDASNPTHAWLTGATTFIIQQGLNQINFLNTAHTSYFSVQNATLIILSIPFVGNAAVVIT